MHDVRKNPPTVYLEIATPAATPIERNPPMAWGLSCYLACKYSYYMTGPTLVSWRHQKMSWTTPVHEAPSPSSTYVATLKATLGPARNLNICASLQGDTTCLSTILASLKSSAVSLMRSWKGSIGSDGREKVPFLRSTLFCEKATSGTTIPMLKHCIPVDKKMNGPLQGLFTRRSFWVRIKASRKASHHRAPWKLPTELLGVYQTHKLSLFTPNPSIHKWKSRGIS